jgi:PAS domain S-box-containing protein
MGKKIVTAESLGTWMESAARMIMELDTSFQVTFANSLFTLRFGDPTGKKCFAHLNEGQTVCPGCPVDELFRGSPSIWKPARSDNGEDAKARHCKAAVPIYDEHGDTIGAAVLPDITLRPQRAEEREQEFPSTEPVIPTPGPDVTFTLDDSGAFVFAHSRDSELFGAPVDGMLGRRLWELVSPEHAELARTVLETPPDSVWEHDVAIVDANGVRKSVRLRCRASCDPQKKAKVFDGTIRKHDTRARLEEHLRTYHEYLEESERRYRTLVEQLPDVVFSMDRDGRFIFLNSQVLQLLGYPIRKMIETYLWDYTYLDSTERARSLLTIEEGNIWDEELWLIDSQGRRKWARIRCKPLLDLSGNIKGFEGVMRDRTARKMLEEELRTSKEELMEKMRVIDDLYEQMAESKRAKSIAQHTAQVAHELKQPLSIIGGFARRLARQVEPDRRMDPGTQKECFRIMIKEVQRLETMLGDLVNFARNETIHLRKTDPNALVEEVLRIHEERLKEHGIAIAMHLDKRRQDVFLDPDRFQHVVRNLVANAIEASEPGGVIDIETGIFTAAGEAEQLGDLRCSEYFVLKITNQGKVIPPQDMRRIFDPFYTTKDGGTGVGLTLVKKIVEEHKGAVTVKSDTSGTVFTVWVPRRATSSIPGEDADIRH